MDWDRQRVLQVEPAGFGQRGYPWPCTRCGHDFDSGASWLVRYRVDERAQAGFVVCPGCAEGVAEMSLGS